MDIKTKLNTEDIATWFSPDYKEWMKGTVKEIQITIKEGKADIMYMLEADREIKMSKIHFIKESELEDGDLF